MEITQSDALAAASAPHAEIFAGGPDAARRAAVPPSAPRRNLRRRPGCRPPCCRAAVLSAEAGDVHSEMWGEHTVGLHLALMACLHSAVIFGYALARRRDIRPAEPRWAARTIGGSLRAAAEASR
jgi:hypothetical protein